MNARPSKAQAESIRAKLANLARSRGHPYDKLMTIFLLERAALRLVADEVLARHIIFKGGYVVLRVYNSPRYTTDLDALLRGLPPEEAMARIRMAVEANLGDAVWYVYEETVDLKTQGEYGGTRLVFRAGIGEQLTDLTRAQVIKLDFGIGDPVVPKPLTIVTKLTLGEGELSWQVYRVETILAEKLHALVTLGARNSRSKDVFDVNLLLPQAALEDLKSALTATFAFRGDPLPTSLADTIMANDRRLLRAGWQSALRAVSDAFREFDETYDLLVEQLRARGL